MNFADIGFWVVLACATACVLALRVLVAGRMSDDALTHFDKISLFLTGLALLGFASMLTLVIFLLVTVVAYFGLKWIVRFHSGSGKGYMWLLIVLMLLPLLYYKYSYFFCSVIIDRPFEVLKDMVIPVGISFYTFQKIGFVVDTLQYKKPVPRFIDYVNFAGFFPQIVAGPIERRAQLLPQMEAFRLRWNWDHVDCGIRYVILGLFFKLCLADNLALLFDHGESDTVWRIWYNNVVFGLRIYFDFAGYGITAVGLAKCLGIDLIMNFNSPYTSGSISEFWRRWHISLTNWFRDYIYFNIGGSRTRWWAMNMMIVFLISGLWHGASWNFVIWGGLCGLGLIVHRLYKKMGVGMWPPIAWLLTMATCFYIWMFFYETRLDVLYDNTLRIIDPNGYNLTALREYLKKQNGVSMVFLLVAVVILVEFFSLKRRKDPYAWFTQVYVSAVLILLTVWFAPDTSSEFIYFAF